jgi:fructose-bisphosphate aldolase / 2-amino-3,7-dideoxy-D-threo-hept-6-ulosonate synthase
MPVDAQVFAASVFTGMSSEKQLRLRRLFRADGRMLLVAMDHAGFMGPVRGLDLPTMAAVVRAGADAVMTTYGTARRASHAASVLGQAALVVSLDINATEPEEQVLNALRLGADSVKVLASSGDKTQWTALYRYALVCERWGVPFQAEVIPGGFDQPDKHTPDNIALVTRQAAEMGADYVKTLYTGDPETMRRVVEGATVPVVILGGDRAANDEALLRQVADALSAGVSGVAFGRNIWSHADPASITRRLVDVIHAAALSTAQRTLVAAS